MSFPRNEPIRSLTFDGSDSKAPNVATVVEIFDPPDLTYPSAPLVLVTLDIVYPHRYRAVFFAPGLGHATIAVQSNHHRFVACFFRFTSWRRYGRKSMPTR